MWMFEHVETTGATSAQLWACYADPPTWPRWDHEVAKVTVDGPLAVSTHGILEPVKGPRTPFTFTDVTPGAAFTTVSRLPFVRLAFVHLIEPMSSGSRLTHRITITGPLSPLVARVIGKGIAAGLPTAMRTLIGLAETTAAATGVGAE